MLLFTAINNCVLGSNLIYSNWCGYMALLHGQLVSRQRKNNTFLKKHINIIFFKKNCLPIKVVLNNTFQMIPFFQYESFFN